MERNNEGNYGMGRTRINGESDNGTAMIALHSAFGDCVLGFICSSVSLSFFLSAKTVYTHRFFFTFLSSSTREVSVSDNNNVKNPAALAKCNSEMQIEI